MFGGLDVKGPFLYSLGLFHTLLGTSKGTTLRLLGMSWGVKTTCLEAPGVSLGGSGVSIGGVGSLRVVGG